MATWLFGGKMIRRPGASLKEALSASDHCRERKYRSRCNENDDHASCIYSLYDIRDENDKHINNTAAYDKQYLEGRYGADPYLQNNLGHEWDESKAD